MAEADREFYQRRLVEELDRAEAANSAKLRQLHYSWAGEYRKRLDRIERKPEGGPGGIGQWQLRATNVTFGDWLADIA